MSQERGIPALAQAPDAGSLNARYSGWVAAIAGGDESALAAFYDATLSRVYGLALRITQSAGAAEEVLNDVYMQVWREAGRYKAARGRVMTWLLTICRSRALDYLRKRNVLTSTLKPKVIDEQSQARVGVPLDLIPSSQVDQGDPQDLLDAVEQHTTVRIALDRLAPLQRQLIALAFYKDMSHQEIAAYTGLALGTVKSHIRRGIGLLRETLRNQTPEQR